MMWTWTLTTTFGGRQQPTYFDGSYPRMSPDDIVPKIMKILMGGTSKTQTWEIELVQDGYVALVSSAGWRIEIERVP